MQYFSGKIRDEVITGLQIEKITASWDDSESDNEILSNLKRPSDKLLTDRIIILKYIIYIKFTAFI